MKNLKSRLVWAAVAGAIVLLIGLSPTVMAQSQSSDATLSALTLSDVDFGTFDSGNTSYTASVANRVTETTVTPMVDQSGASYVIKLDGTEDSDGTVSLSVGSNVITVEVTAEDRQTTQTYTVTVTRAANNSAPGKPTGLSSTWSDDGAGITLNWTAPTGTVTGYQILRVESPALPNYWEPLPYGCTAEWVVHVADTGNSSTTYTDTGVVEGAIYAYRTKAMNGSSSGPQSNATLLQHRHVYWPSGPPGTPRSPRNLEGAQAVHGTEFLGIDLTWDEPAEPPPVNVTGYQILRRQPEECEFGYRVYVENTNSTSTSWRDTNAEIGTLYEYHVRAINDNGVGSLNTSDLVRVRPAVGTSNSPATGTPTISGTAQVGQTLTASTSGISDSDGLTNVSYSYQWLADDTEIDEATSSTYTVQSSDNGKVIKVRVTFTDDGGSDESLTSVGTAAVVMGGL